MKEPSCGSLASINNEDAGSVNRTPDPEWILALVDLIFLGQEEGRVVPS